MYSTPNIVMKLFRRRLTATTLDIEENLYNNDLEWDKSDLTRHLSESDALSSYDINEMDEIFRHGFLEFDMSSEIDGYSTSSINDVFSPISKRDFHLFDIEFLNKNSIKKRSFYRSLSELNLLKQQQKKNFFLSKHLSLMDIKSIQWIILKSHEIFLIKENSYRSIPQSMEIESEEHLFNSITTDNFSYLSKLEMIRLYLTKIREKFYSLVSKTFQPTKTTLITEEIIETYDIIEE